jgi:hypothetical protein
MLFRTLMWSLLLLLGCALPAAQPAESLRDQTVEAGCGMCQYSIVESRGCYWAIQWRGEVLVVQGQTPANHDNHGPDGMCNMTRQAVVSGHAKGGQFYAQKFKLLPAGHLPAQPRFSDQDRH